MATTTDKTASLETGLGGKQLVGGKPTAGVAGSWLWEHVDTEQTTMQFGGYCLLTGLTSAPTFAASFIWPGFQTGNFVQLSLAVARLFAAHPRDTRFEIPDRQALTSLLCFLLGTSLGRLGDRIGPRRRIWVSGATFFQALLVMAAALCIHFSGEPSVARSRADPSWHSALGLAGLGFVSASLGLQGIVAKRLNSQFGTAIVLTTVWVELICDPKLFVVKAVKTRDHRFVAVTGLFLGGLFGTALTYTIGAPATFGVIAGVRVASALSWLVVPTARKA